MPIETILLFFFADLAICLTPGPATAVAASYAASGGIRGALGPITGIHAGNFIWYGLSAIGLIALITAAPDIYTAIRWAGVVYLLWMGWRMIRSAAAAHANPAIKTRNTDFWPGFGSGLAVHMSNPKALLFYASFLPQFIDADRAILPQIAIFAAITLVTESIGLFTYAYATVAAQRMAEKRLSAFSFDQVAGSVLIVVALIMAVLNSQ